MDPVSILIVDDDEIDRYLLTRDLSRTGIETQIFEQCDGRDALAFLQAFEANRREFGTAFPPTLIFLDINMPRMTGFEFLEAFAELRGEDAGLESCVVMMFSSSEHAAEQKNAYAYDFVKDFIVKGKTDVDALKNKILALFAE